MMSPPSSPPWVQWGLALVPVVVYIFAFFPTSLELDAASMYQDAVHLRYVDYWPPLTLMVWHALSRVQEGGDLMLLMNLLFFWGAYLMGFSLFRGKRLAYIFPLIPFVPSIFLDADSLLKDTFFSFGYMFLSMILAHYTMKGRVLKPLPSVLLLLGIFYFSMIKVQAAFIFPFMVLWVVWLWPPLTFRCIPSGVIKGAMVLVLSLGLFVGMRACNKALVQPSGNAHFWQYVKIYDLAGMSVQSQKMYVPTFLLKHQQVTVKDIEDHYEYLWEPLIRYEHSPLVQTQSDEERVLLRRAWRDAIYADPLAYMKHRLKIWFKILSGSALKGAYVKYVGESPFLLKFAFLFSAFSFLPLLPFFLYFLMVSVRDLRKRREALPAFILSAMGLMLISVLFVCSLAAAGRYIYFSWCCFMFALPFVCQLKAART